MNFLQYVEAFESYRITYIQTDNIAADSFHTKKLCSRLSSSEVRFFTQIGRFAFFRPSLGDLGATYDDHLGLIGKRVVDVFR